MKSTLGALCLVLVLVWTNAAELDCVGLNKTLGPQELHKVEGDWVLVWSVSDSPKGSELLLNVSSSHVEMRRLPDNKTLTYLERNVYLENKFSTYNLTLTVPESDDGEYHSLVSLGGTVEVSGKVETFNDSAKVDFFQTCDQCLKFIYGSPTWGRFLLLYRREGHHRDVEEMSKEHGAHRKLAECLGLPLDTVYVYDGVSDFQHRKSAPDQTVSGTES